MSNNSTKALEVLAAGRLLAMSGAPYFRARLLSFVTRPVPGLGSVAATKRSIFLYDPDVIAGWTAPMMAGAWIHEVMHLLLKHFDRSYGRNPELLGKAQDLAINPGVIDMGFQLPEGSIFPEKFGWERGLTSDEYYTKLEELAEQGAGGGSAAAQGQKGQSARKGKGKPAQGDEDGDGEPGEGEGGGKPGVGRGWCGSCSARPVPGEPGDDDPDGRGDAENERINRQVAEEIRSAANGKQRGTIPQGWLKWADASLDPPTIPWQTKLARATRSAATWAAGAVDHRYDRPGRRQAGIGYGHGKPVLPRMRRPIPQVAIAIDTSGSMGPDETFAAVTEVQGVLRAVDAAVTFCACDAAVHSLEPIRQIGDVAKLLKGGGGTDFAPVFEALDKAKPRPEVVIFMTDGYGPAPVMPPVGMRVIWVLTGKPARVPYTEGGQDVTYGEVIEIPLDK